MNAVVYERYGSPDVIEVKQIAKPVVGDDEVLVSVRAASVNPYDWHFLTGTPYIVRPVAGLRKPKLNVLGVDFAGQVEAVGKNRTEFQHGDEVFGMRDGAFAEFVSARKVVIKKPANLTFEQAAAVPMAALTALQGLRDKGHVQAGQTVLINGASGGIGTFAVQIAKSFGAEVTGVCSTRNVDMVRGLGADHVIDYTREDFTRNGRQYDLILDMVGTRSGGDRKRALSANGLIVEVGGPTGRWGVGVIGTMLVRSLTSRFSGSKKLMGMLATANKDDLIVLQQLIEAGKVKPVIDKRFKLSEAPQALAYVGAAHTQGKTILAV